MAVSVGDIQLNLNNKNDGCSLAVIYKGDLVLVCFPQDEIGT